MSKELIPLPYTPQKKLKLTPQDAHWAVDPRNMYKPTLLTKHARNLLEEPLPELILALPGVVVFPVGGMIWGLLAGVSMNEAVEVGLGAWFTAVMIAFPFGHWLRKRSRLLALNVREHLAEWVNARYGLHTTAETFNNRLAGYVNNPNGTLGIEFRMFETDGKKFNFKRSQKADGGVYIEEIPTPPDTDYKPLDTVTDPSTVTPTTPTLPGEAGVLAAGLVNMLELLKTKALDETITHAVNRVQTDLIEMTDLYQELSDFGPVSDTDLAAMVNTLNSLHGEIDRVLIEQKAIISRKIAVQQRYITNRAETPPATLQLGATQAETSQV